MRKYLRGEIYYACLDPIIGSEEGGYRPVLILQNNLCCSNSQTVLIAPLTKYINRAYYLPVHVGIKSNKQLKYDSIILLEQIRVIDKRRIKNYVMKISKKKQFKVNKAIIKILDLEEEL